MTRRLVCALLRELPDTLTERAGQHRHTQLRTAVGIAARLTLARIERTA